MRLAAEYSGTDPLDPAGYAAALSDILWTDGGGNSLDRAISYLETLARLAPDPAVVLADLSGAYLARAELRQTPEDLFRALEAAARVLEVEPNNVVARFNRALALEYIGADRTAAEAWESYARIDRGSGWGREAQRRAHEVKAFAEGAVSIAPPAPGASVADVEVFVAEEPGAARVYGWGEVLGAWGRAVLQEDRNAARHHLALADAIARVLVRQGGDGTLADAVAMIQSESTQAGLTRLAQGHRIYAEALRAYEEVGHTAARPFVEELRALKLPPSPLLSWTRRLEALVLLAEGEFAATAAGLASAAGEVDTVRYPGLGASLHQTRGTALLRAGQMQQARDAWTQARRLFERAGERESAGGTRYLEADAEFMLGLPEAHATMHRAIMELRSFRRSRWLHTSLAVMALELADEGLPRAALAIYDEDLQVATLTGRPIYEAEARLLRAQLLVAMERRAAAEGEVATAEPIVLGLPPGERREWFEGYLHSARAVLLLRDNPQRAAAQMDSLLAAPGGARTEPRILLGLLGRAQARLATGDAGGAITDLDSATSLLAQRGDAVTTVLLRSSILDAARKTFDQLVMLRLAGGDTLGALQALERGRFSLAHGRGSGGSDAAWTLPSGTAALDYALVGDTLLGWAVTPRGTVLHRAAVNRAALLRNVERLRSIMVAQARESELHPLLEALYDQLMRPLAPVLPVGGRLAIVADGELADIPFAALHDRRSGQYLIERHTIVAATSLRDVRRGDDRPLAAAKPALLVWDPAFDLLSHPDLERLPGAVEEARDIASLYRDTLLLDGPRAGASAVTERLARARVFHFAGHAVFDDERPTRSFLLLAPGRDDPSSGRLTAADLGALDLRALDLVVLSSCETLRSPGRRSGGFAGLAGALLGAGVNGVVGSPWRVQDGLARPLMADLHRRFLRTGDGAGSLRAAQMRALRGGYGPALRTPAVWASYRYTGN